MIQERSVDDTHSEEQWLRRCLRDLIAFTSLPLVWKDKQPRLAVQFLAADGRIYPADPDPATGSFTIAAIPPGTYRVSAKKQGYRPPKPQTVRVKSKGITRWDILFPPIDIINDPAPDPTPIRKPSSF